MKPYEIQLGGRSLRLELDSGTGAAKWMDAANWPDTANQTDSANLIDANASEPLVNNSGSASFTWEPEIPGSANGPYLLRVGQKIHRVDVVSIEHNNVRFMLDGRYFETVVSDSRDLLLKKLGLNSTKSANSGSLYAPMPGKVLDVLVTPGMEVSADQPLAILEAMKMENELKSPIDGTINGIHAKVGQSVEKGYLILEIQPRG